jgi:cation-transporting ATPase F
LAAHEVLLVLEADAQQGLTSTEARRRLERYGPNLLPAAARGGPLPRLLRQFHHPLIYILLAAGLITAGVGEYVDSAVIFGVVVINAVIGFVQESKAAAALDALRSMVRTSARVVRDGREQQVTSEEIVPGDLVLLEAGDKVPADLRLVRLAELRVDESALTGESAPVVKDEVVLPHVTPVADRRNMVYSGTLVTAGAAAGIAVGTGAETQLGQIHRLVGSAETLATPLSAKLARFSKVLTVAILALAAVTFGIGLVRGQPMVQTFTAAIALAVGTIPEGLPAAVTITLAIGVARMARRRAVIRRLPAVETLGSTTVICSDKTGTLTANQMTVRAVWTPDGDFDVSGSGYAPTGEIRDAAGNPVTVGASEALRWCLLAGAGCNDATLTQQDGRWELVGDPTEAAMLVVAAKAGITGADLARRLPRVATVPFSSERQYMATLHRGRDAGGHVVLAKGAVERIVASCTGQMGADGGVRPLDAEAVLAAADRLAGGGLRVLATATCPGVEPEQFGVAALRETMVLTGLQAMLDPPRPAATAAVRACHTAGITVKMITGDHAATATAIADRLDLLDRELPEGGYHAGGPAAGSGRGEVQRAGDRFGGRVLTGVDLQTLPAGSYDEAVDRARVFARVSPEQKLRLVEALQGRGHVVAMTGDGVNDAPALRQANIGIAMGRGGTEVAKEAADMVLTDDDFATIEAAVEEGRGVFDNLTKFIVWTLPTNMGQGLVILVAILFGTALPILPTQILWINMTTAVLLGLMLAFEPKEAGTMSRPPRDPGRPLLTSALGVRILLVSVMIVGGAWWLFEWELGRGAGLAEARTAAMNLVVVVQLFYLFSCRSLTRSMWRIGPLSNRWIVGGVLTQAVAQAAITYLPAMNDLFHTAPINWQVWLRIVAIGVLTSIVVAADKRLRRQPM